MKKALRKILIGTACCAMVLPMALPLSACGQANDPETRAVSLALGACDQNFNPFFYTSQNDGEVIALTQVPLISANREAEVACGDDEATVALAYKEVMYDASGNVTSTGDANGRTEYEFVIKNGIKFSDGEDLTIKDVLFNLYVYLDPMYTGSSTIYSTKIKGLAAYRAQNPNLADDADDNYTSNFIGPVNTRFSDLVSYDSSPYTNSKTPQLEKDLLLVAEEFESELNSDWTSNVGTVKSYEEKYRFTEDWEVFYFNEGFIDYQRDASGKRKTDENGKYLTTIDVGATNDQTHLRDNMQTAISSTNVKAYAAANNCSEEEAKEVLMQQQAVKEIFNEYLNATKGNDGKFTSADRRSNGSLYKLLTQWNTGSSVRQRILNNVMSEAYSSGNELAVKSISGITTYNTAEKPFSGATAGSALKSGENYDVLKIVINGVDPAAKWTFGFTVAPMHYYSNEEMTQKAMATASNNDNVSNRFGVMFSNETFFDTVLKASSKTAKPVGAGAYKSLNNLIYNNKEANYERNEYFHTVGANLENAKIRYLKYKTVSDDQLVNTLVSNGLDYGMPNCSKDNIQALAGKNHLTQIPYDANGFGYVGINPKFVPELGVRQAIMKAMNVTSITRDYYGSDYASVITRPISKTSWAYPKNATEYEAIKYTGDTDEIDRLVRSSGYRKDGDVYVSNKTGKALKLTFTIAGESTDHPAYRMFLNAAEKLNEIGFDITVQYDIQALAKLATGKLAVWAAAWSTGIDPDMYQVYHKDSKASSVKNWGYDVILNDTQGIYGTELAIVNALAKDIEDARSIINRDSRMAIYERAYDKVMSLAVELPTYQRKDIAVYNNSIIDGKTLNGNANANEGVLSRIWELNYV